MGGERFNLNSGGSGGKKNHRIYHSSQISNFFQNKNNAHVPSCKDDNEHVYFGGQKIYQILGKGLRCSELCNF